MKKKLYQSITNKFSFNNKNKTSYVQQTKSRDDDDNNNNNNSDRDESVESTTSKEKLNYNTVKQAIVQRRSVRKYTPHKPPFRLISDIIQSASQTARPGNIVSFHTIIIQDKSIIATISNLCYQQSWIAQAPCVLVITSSQNEMSKLYPDMATRFSYQVTASYITNLLLLIQAAGLSSCWIESIQEEVLKDYLNIPKSQEIHAVLPIGYGKEINDAPYTPSFLSLVSFNSYGNKENK